MERDEAKVNDAARLQIEQRIFKEGEFYAASNDRQKKENKARAESRERIKAAGIRTDAYALGVKLVKNMPAKDRAVFLDDLQIVIDVLGQRQAELFPEEAMKMAKKAEKEKAAAAEAERVAKENAAKTGDDNPRSDPNKGGAKPRTGKGKPDLHVVPEVPGTETGDELIKRVAAEENAKKEQREGGALLATAGKGGDKPVDNGKPKSQSQIAKEARTAAKLN